MGEENDENSDQYLTVNLRKMLVMLNNVFTLPRNYRGMDGLRGAASDYISQKFGNLGLLVGIQYFFPSRFYEQVLQFIYSVSSLLKTVHFQNPISNLRITYSQKTHLVFFRSAV